MKNDTHTNIIKFIEENKQVKPSDIARAFNLSTQSVHWHLRKLKSRGLLQVIGSPPKTHYAILKETKTHIDLPKEFIPTIEDRFCYLSPRGELLTGLPAFSEWLKIRNLEKDAATLAKAYKLLITSIYDNLEQPFSTLERLRGILTELNFSDVFISDFYALPQFGKTHLGNLVHAAKTTGDRRFPQEITHLIKPDLEKLIKKFRPDNICFVPHSIPRKVQFLPELEIQLNLQLPTVNVHKLFFGNVPVAQKSLSKTSERIENAQKTFAIPYGTKIKGSVLLIDDAVGSGATLNAIANMLLSAGAKKIIGYAIVGSYMGFEVLPQV